MSNPVPLTFEERETVSLCLAAGMPISSIAAKIGRHRSVIYREISRNGGKDDYRAVAAQDRCDTMRERPKRRKLESCARLHDAVNEGPGKEWSPRQISKRLAVDYPDDPEMRVSPGLLT